MAKANENDKQVLLPGTLELLVLKVLTRGAQHGYGIVREIQRRSAEALVVEEGSLYPALHRMERRGWIEAEWGASDSNRRAKFYALTRPGRRELAAQTENWRRMTTAVEGVLAPEGA
jgi:transcriptional regulator